MVKKIPIILLVYLPMAHGMALRQAVRPLSKQLLIWRSRRTIHNKPALAPLVVLNEPRHTDLNAQLCNVLSASHINFIRAIKLVAQGAHPKVTSVRGINIVQHLVGRPNYNENTIKIIEKYPSIVHTLCFTGSTPLHNAVRTLNIEMVQTLIASGVDVNKQNIYGYAPLHTLADYHTKNSPELIRVLHVLIKHGANPLLCTYDKQTAAEITQERNNMELYRIIKSIEVMFYSTK